MQIQLSDFGLALYISITEREIILSITKHFSVKCKTLTILTIFQALLHFDSNYTKGEGTVNFLTQVKITSRSKQRVSVSLIQE